MTPALTSLLLFLAFIPLPTPHLVWVALVPWLLHLERAGRGGAGVEEAARTGARVLGLFWALHLSWVLLLIPRLGVLWPLWAYLGQLLLLALLGAAAGAGIHLLRLRSTLPLPAAAALGWVGVEWSRGHLLGPLRFPWSPVALPLADALPFVQPAAWVGEAGLGMGVVAVNGVVAMAWMSRGTGPAPRGLRPSRPGFLFLAACVLAVWWGAGRARLAGLTDVEVVTAGVIQPGLSLSERRDSARALTAARERVSELLPGLRGSGAAVVVIPETHYPVVFPASGDEPSDPWARLVIRELADAARELDAQILAGGYGEAEDGVTNALVRVTPDGVAEVYGKVALVPGVERAPGSSLRPGSPPAPFRGAGLPGPLICIESAWSGLALDHARRGAGWLLNVTNDAWLAEEPLWTRTPAFHQHPRHLVLRSVETGLGALRVGNNGLTGVVAASGAWTLLLPPHGAGVAVASVARLPAGTLYRATGDLAGPAGALSLLAALGLAFLARRRPPVDQGKPRL